MKKLLSLLIIVSCNTQSEESMRAEYDSLTRYIPLQKKTIESVRSRYTPSYDMSEEASYYLRKADSLELDAKRLEKRKQELAERLFK